MILDRLLSENSSSAWAQPMCTLFLLRRTSQKCILFVEGCSRMHFQENTSMSWVCKRRVRATRHIVCVVDFTWSPQQLLCLGREGWRSGLDSVCAILRFPFHAMFGSCVL